jgi:hypothetical protein
MKWKQMEASPHHVATAFADDLAYPDGGPRKMLTYHSYLDSGPRQLLGYADGFLFSLGHLQRRDVNGRSTTVFIRRDRKCVWGLLQRGDAK